jgi:hypothetical protein
MALWYRKIVALMLGFVGAVTRLPARFALHTSINVFLLFMGGCGMGMTSARKSRIIASFAVAKAISTSSAAFAQCTSTATGTPIFGPQFTAIAATGGAASSSFAGALGNIRTAFLTQQGSAFVSAPGDPKLDQPGGGVWVRGIGGEVTNKFSSGATGNLNAGIFNPIVGTEATSNCAGSMRQTVGGPGRAGHFAAQLGRLECARRYHRRLPGVSLHR